ncbi:GatB/YqeY domain-containing protein [Hesseltinella vesiculosa]|uniref:Altered inheritance of mitochondria protein 41 n=1 Tax=Hesseltinella vesiculosa TaxID=101127 RepID=A0A1X2G623_9FUNG|nr:GatB/YqeY domain-containing protein [Hesseltinella vesiculosa]
MAILLQRSVRSFTPLYRTRLYSTSVSLVDRLKQDRKTFMRSKQQPQLNVVKGVLSDLIYQEKAGVVQDASNPDGLILSVIQKNIKRRQDSVKQYLDGGRPELAAVEQEEISVLQDYLPEQMSQQAIEEKVQALVSELGASSIKDMGKVMKAWTVDPATADRKLVSDAVKKILAQ